MEAFCRTSSSTQRRRQGYEQNQEPRKITSDCSSRSAYTTDDDLSKRDSRLRYSNQPAATPIKRLLADQMSKETEPKRRPPSIIARLMGFDGMPSQPPTHKQERRSLENCMKKPVATGKPQKSTASSSRGSSRKNSREEQEFKDVYEVLESSRKGVEISWPRGSPSSKIAEAEMAFIQQKFMDAKRLSTDGKLQDSKEFRDTIEDLNSNQDLLLRFLEQPDSMFTKHLHELHGVSPRSYCSHTSGAKVPLTEQCKGDVLVCNSGKQTPRRSRRKPLEDRCNHHHSKQPGSVTVKESKAHLDEKEESTIVPTRIVVLKPNLARLQNRGKPVSSPSSHCDQHAELPSMKRRGSESHGKKHADDIRHSICISGDYGEIAKGSASEVRDSLSSSTISFPISGVRGYAGDESSSCRSGYESATESDVTTVPSRHSLGRRKGYRGSPARPTESSVSREARKRLSERWKMTHKSVDMGVVSRSSTLGEMLEIYDRNVMPASSDSMVAPVATGKLSRNDGAPNLVEPLGISSRDGWKDPFIKSLPRSKSLPASPAASAGSPRVASHRKTLYDDSYRTEVKSRERNKMVKGNRSQGEGLSSRSSRARSRRSITLIRTYRDEGDTSPESPLSYINLEKTFSEENPKVVYEELAGDSRLLLDNVSTEANMAVGNLISWSTSVNPESPTGILVKGDSSPSDLEAFSSQELTGPPPPENCSTPVTRLIAEPESSASPKEGDQPSPVSVLETAFADDLSSSSDCFESLSADLQGLRMQLKLLKLESETYDEGPPMAVSSEEQEAREDSAEENAEHSYIADVLLNSGIDDADPNSFGMTLYSSECPVSLSVFEELEKKHSSHIRWPRQERRLLFDQINKALVVIDQQFNDPHPWVLPRAKIGLKWVENGLKDGVYELVTRQGKRAEMETEDEQVLSGEHKWLDIGGEIEAIGREIERVLVEDLVTELIAEV